MTTTNQHFQVHLQGMIDLLSNHLYADPGVFIRELLQNGVDAITARKQLGHMFTPQIHVDMLSSDTVSFQDNGCGLTMSEIDQFLAKIGSTTKRDNLDGADDFIGQFGVGLLSCFVVSDEIVLITRSALEGDALEWRGRPDGTYTTRKLTSEMPIGTTVYLKMKPDYDAYADETTMQEQLERFGAFLDTPIYLRTRDETRRINEETAPWQMTKDEAIEYIERTMYQKPIDVIPLYSVLGEVEGIAYILPHPVSLQEEKQHKVYLKRMLLTDSSSSMLPPWAFFVTAILNTNSLKPTASRESFRENDLFYEVRDELGAVIKRHLMMLAEQQPDLFRRILYVHGTSVKAMAVEDDDLYQLMIPYLMFETSYGDMEMKAIVEQHDTIVLAPTLDEFRQIARVAKAQQMMVINGGYVHDFDLVRQLPRVMPHVKLSVLDILAFSHRFEPLRPLEQAEVEPFLAWSNELLEPFQCQSLVRSFEPADLPVLYNTSQDVHFFKLAEDAEVQANALFGPLVHAIHASLYEKPYAKLCYNYNNPIVRKAIASQDKTLQRTCIELFYTQALLLGNHTMRPEEMRLMNESLLHFMNLGLDQAGDGTR